ncbi:MAG: hypothetical protein AAAFM81_03050 [Pseudomonadota bacterium]
MKAKFLVFVTLMLCVEASASETLEIDHSKKSALTLKAAPGAFVEFNVVNTCPVFFNYQTDVIRDLPESTAGGVKLAAALPKCEDDALKKFLTENRLCEMGTKKLSTVHGKDVTAYEIKISRNDGSTDAVTGFSPTAFANLKSSLKKASCPTTPAAIAAIKAKGSSLENTTRLVSVETNPWSIGLSGGFTASRLTDPVFAVVPNSESTADPAGTIVVGVPGAEDSFSPAAVGFVHAHNRNWQIGESGIYIAPTFGLGVEESGDFNMFAGIAFDFGNQWYINLGVNGRQVDRLPSGQRLGEAPINDNVLADLPTRFDTGLYVGFSFAFASPGEDFFKGKVGTVKPD